MILVGMCIFMYAKTKSALSAEETLHPKFWSVQSIDTVKYSRDVAREKLHDSSFDTTIDAQIKQIASTGATHVAIGTPYDDEFLPYLKRWVSAARTHNLHVWFRGNWSGWEGWFNYPNITAKQHVSQTVVFIKNNPDLFVDGDIFSPCPECENGQIGDPRQTGKIQEFRQFLIDLTNGCETAATEIKKSIICNYHSMNGDVARLIMDKETTQKLGGVVVVDHYVKEPTQMAKDLKEFALQTGGKVVLGEFGAPLPDIHGNMSQEQQAAWISETLNQVIEIPEVVGVNYWTNVGGSTGLWDSHNQPRVGVSSLSQIYQPNEIIIHVKNIIDKPIVSSALYLDKTFASDKTGSIRLPKQLNKSVIPAIIIAADGYKDQGVYLGATEAETTIVLEKQSESIWFKLQVLLFKLSHSII